MIEEEHIEFRLCSEGQIEILYYVPYKNKWDVRTIVIIPKKNIPALLEVINYKPTKLQKKTIKNAYYHKVNSPATVKKQKVKKRD